MHCRLLEVLNFGTDDVVNVGVAAEESFQSFEAYFIKSRIAEASSYVIALVLLVTDLVDGSHERQAVNHPPFDPSTVEVCDFTLAFEAMEIPFETIAFVSSANPSNVDVSVVREADFDVVSHHVSHSRSASVSVRVSCAEQRIV